MNVSADMEMKGRNGLLFWRTFTFWKKVKIFVYAYIYLYAFLTAWNAFNLRWNVSEMSNLSVAMLYVPIAC